MNCSENFNPEVITFWTMKTVTCLWTMWSTIKPKILMERSPGMLQTTYTAFQGGVNMDERINEVLRLIDIQLATVPDNPIEESYKARTLASYVQALNGLLTAQKSYKEETNE